MSFNKQILKTNATWSAAFAGVIFAVFFGWMLYYAATANEGTTAHPHILHVPIFSVDSIDRGFEIGPDYGMLALPLFAGAVVFVLALLFRAIVGRFTQNLPE